MYTSPAAQMSLYFNSTIVQLIETRKNTTDFTCKNFNSTIVQLIGRPSKSNKGINTHFNSTIVQLIGILVI